MRGFSFKARLNIVSATWILAVACSVPAHAQDTNAAVPQDTAPAQEEPASQDDAATQDIIVTGFRESLASALNAKRNSNLIIESVTAEDIGKFPDQNITESLQRLPGIQIDRENGQGTRVRIRGLDQNVTVLNGELFVTGLEAFKVGEGNFTRNDSLEGVPSELIGGVDVYKSPNASLLEGGLGGIIDLKTRGALDLKPGLTLGGNARVNKGSEISGWKPTGALVVGYNFDDRFGIIASLSYDRVNQHNNVLGGENRGNWAFANRVDSATVPNYYAPEYRYVTDRDIRRERWGGSLGVTWRPTDELELAGQFFHSDYKVDTREASLKFPFAQGEARGLQGGFSIDDDGVLQQGTMRAQSAEAISFVDVSNTTSDNAQFTVKFDNKRNFRLNVAATYSQGDLTRNVANNDVRYTAYAVPTANPSSPTGFSHQPANPAAPATFDFTYDNRDGKFPSFGIASGSPQDLFTNPAYGYFKSHWAFGDRSEIDGQSFRADMAWDIDDSDTNAITVSAGFRYGRRNIDFTSGRYLADISGMGEPDGSQLGYNWTPYTYFLDGAIGFKACEIPVAQQNPQQRGCDNRFGNSPPVMTPFQTFTDAPDRVELIKNFAGGGVVQGDQVLVQNRAQMTDALAWIQGLFPDKPFAFFEDPIQSFFVREETRSGYVMADIGSEDDPYHVNVGVRIVDTKLRVDQNQGVADPVYFGTDSWNGVVRDFETTTFDRSYTDFLPSLNVVASIDDRQKVRFSAARVVARQDLFSLGRGFATDFTRDPQTNLFTFTSGSRGNPELEPYRAYQFDAAYEYYFGRQGLLSIAGFWKEVDSFIVTQTVPTFVSDQAGGRLGPVAQPVNGTGGQVRGFEVAAQYAFPFGLGFTANYTFSDTSTDGFNDFDEGLPLPGVSRHSANGQIYYENYGFAARASYSWRSEAYLGNFGFSDGGTTRTLGIYQRPYGQLDGQISYQVTPMFNVFMEGINLTKSDQSAFLQFRELPLRFESGSRRIYAGVRFNF
ncbi:MULTISPECIES: TonB-dependent receptor [unclassified Sphingomonas]|uniref:TonB-dependent receptor n=1 Tax=unclassified Sphingomonas TaxID=196159 RepID=UPI00082AF02A|nr:MULTISPECIES: TonB-dependent receptor [unclassified Sphingomonas]